MKFRSLFLFVPVRCLAFGMLLAPLLPAQETPLENPPAAEAPVVVEAPPAQAASTFPASEEAEPSKVPVAPLESPLSAAVESETVVAEVEAPAKPLRSLSESPKRKGRRSNQNERVGFGHNSTLAAGESADVVISIMGSSTSAGAVREAVVSILGSSQINGGTVGDVVVSILGSNRINAGTVGDAAVTVLGTNYINGHVRGEVVTVLGSVELGPLAVVDGEIVCIGGSVKQDPASVVHGEITNVGFGSGDSFNFDGLSTWLRECLRYGRLLAFGDNLMWAWWIALGYLGVYLLLALVAPGAVNKCVQTLETRPGKSVVAALLTLLLTPVVYILLTLTLVIMIGLLLIPVFSLALFIAGLLGKAVMLAWLGRRITNPLGTNPNSSPVLPVLIGGVIVLLLYTVPVVGLMVYKGFGVLGLGVVVYTLLESIKSSRPARPTPAATRRQSQAQSSTYAPPVVSAVPHPEFMSAESFETAGVPPAAMAAEEAARAVPPPISVTAPLFSAATLPRAGFWIRTAAALLDVVLIAIVFGVLDGVFSWFLDATGSFPVWFAVYNIVMWVTKGTTIGGIICGLKVVRLDDRPLDWGVGIVRGLSGFLSLFVGGLGFVWVAFDDDKQSWHDKIAGTTIVRVPKGTALL